MERVRDPGEVWFSLRLPGTRCLFTTSFKLCICPCAITKNQKPKKTKCRSGTTDSCTDVCVFRAPGEDEESKREGNVCVKRGCVTAKSGEGESASPFYLQSIQREITGSSSHSCTYIKDAPDSPPAVAMEVAEM